MSYVACRKRKKPLIFCKKLGWMSGPGITVGFSVLVSMIYLLSTVIRLFSLIWQEGCGKKERKGFGASLSLQPHSGVKVIQLLKRVPWTALKSVVEDFGASTEPMEPQCGYRTQKPLSSITTLGFEFWSKNFKTTLFCEGF